MTIVITIVTTDFEADFCAVSIGEQGESLIFAAGQAKGGKAGLNASIIGDQGVSLNGGTLYGEGGKAGLIAGIISDQGVSRKGGALYSEGGKAGLIAGSIGDQGVSLKGGALYGEGGNDLTSIVPVCVNTFFVQQQATRPLHTVSFPVRLSWGCKQLNYVAASKCAVTFASNQAKTIILKTRILKKLSRDRLLVI